MPTKIPFNKPFITGKEIEYIANAISGGGIAADGHFTRRCAGLLRDRFSIPQVLMAPSCTAALEMAAMLCALKPGDEVIMPSFTFVSTANAVVRAGARPVFVDIRPDTLNIDERLIENSVTPNTRAIFPVHYAGVPCEMDTIMGIAETHKLIVAEDAAQGVNATYNGRAVGSSGHLGAYSFHDTKNYVSGEGGALCVNSTELAERAEIIREKGTKRGLSLCAVAHLHNGKEAWLSGRRSPAHRGPQRAASTRAVLPGHHPRRTDARRKMHVRVPDEHASGSA